MNPHEKYAPGGCLRSLRGRSASKVFRQMPFTEFLQPGDILRYDVPQDLQLDLAVFMHDDVSQALDGGPVDLRCGLLPKSVRQSPGQLADLKNAEGYGLLIVRVR